MARLKNTVKFDCANLLIVCHFSFHYEMAENNHLQDLKILSDAYFIGRIKRFADKLCRAVAHGKCKRCYNKVRIDDGKIAVNCGVQCIHTDPRN